MGIIVLSLSIYHKQAVTGMCKKTNPSKLIKKELTMSDKVKEITDPQFEKEVLQSSLPVVVDFWAPWCGPCKAIAPILEEIAGNMGDKVKIVKVNVEDCPNASHTYSIISIPTMILFKNGKITAQKVGAGGKADLSKWISDNV
jgi:thioredoxin 1